ncbi:hypothetical protein [Methylobacterium tarhaniae]|uniref:hypothetical protein n=1 Tax=Methylobacterium tarhaniae TaxID=1187852 RepID=UPI0012ED5D40|nr:hypothetical protein [Methylobacterium tarhaniae]
MTLLENVNRKDSALIIKAGQIDTVRRRSPYALPCVATGSAMTLRAHSSIPDALC